MFRSTTRVTTRSTRRSTPGLTPRSTPGVGRRSPAATPGGRRAVRGAFPLLTLLALAPLGMALAQGTPGAGGTPGGVTLPPSAAADSSATDASTVDAIRSLLQQARRLERLAGVPEDVQQDVEDLMARADDLRTRRLELERQRLEAYVEALERGVDPEVARASAATLVSEARLELTEAASQLEADVQALATDHPEVRAVLRPERWGPTERAAPWRDRAPSRDDGGRWFGGDGMGRTGFGEGRHMNHPGAEDSRTGPRAPSGPFPWRRP